MPIASGPRRFLAASPLHLVAWGTAAALSSILGTSQTLVSNAELWLFLTGFVGFTIIGFAWHLFPTITRRRIAHLPDGRILWAAAESAVVAGFLGLALPLPSETAAGLALGGTLAWLAVVSVFTGAILISGRTGKPPAGPPASSRPADPAAALLFVASWPFGVAAAALWSAGAVAEGPGFGYWIAGVHAFLLGQVGLLIFSVSLRLLPRFTGADGPASLSRALAAAGLAGAFGMPVGFLLVPAGQVPWLAAPGALEGLAAALFLLQLVLLATRATTPRRTFAVFLASALGLIIGGGLGIGMVAASDLSVVPAHVATNLLGFVGLMVLGMWTSMIAPFQFLSHRWSNRVLGLASGLLVLAIALADAGVVWPELGAGTSIGFGLLAACVGIVWSFGSLPVLFPPSRGRTTE